MTGVVVTTATQSGAGSPVLAPSGQWFLVGLAERGPIDQAMKINNMADYENVFGTRQAYGNLYDQLRTFFAEGGSQAIVARTVGAAATVGTFTLNDGADPTVPTLRVDAANPGAWSNNMTVEVRAGTNPNTFRILVALGGVTVEDYNNLDSPATAVSKFRNSYYVRLTDLGSASVAPANNPAVMAATVLTAGSDDRASVTAANYVSALALFTNDFGTGAVSIPGMTGSTVYQGIIDHCMATNMRIGILAGDKGDSDAEMKTKAASVASEYVGIFTPWVQISDGTSSGIREISPEGYVAACRARAHSQVGPWRVPAGSIAKATSLLGLDKVYTQDEGTDLNESKVSVIRMINGTIRLYGWRSLSNDPDNYFFLKDRDLLNYLVYAAGMILEEYVDQTIDGKNQLASLIKSDIIGMVDPIAQAGGLYAMVAADGKTVIDPGYLVDTSSAINTLASLAQNIIKANLYVRVSPAADTVQLNIIKVGLQSSF